MDTQAISQLLQHLQISNQKFLNQLMEENQQRITRFLQSDRPQSSVSTFRSFSKATDNWPTYFLQLEQHFVANGIQNEERKRACFLSWIGSETLELLQKLFEGKVEEQTFKDIITKLNEHFVKKQHVLAARVQFYKTTMKSNQTYADWIADLRGVAKDCMFYCEKVGCSHSYVDNEIRDMLVIHTPHDKVRSAILQKPNPTLEEVIQIATIYESTVNTCLEIKGEENADVYAVQQFKSKIPNRLNDVNFKSCPACGKIMLAHYVIDFLRQTLVYRTFH